MAPTGSRMPASAAVRVTGNGTWYTACTLALPVLYARANLREIDAAVSAITVTAILASA
jgi:hypothetical protein